MMSNALAIAAVTAVLKDLLQNTLIDHDLASSLGGVTVSAQPPDRIVPGSSGQFPSQLNLFLYQVVSNQGWRNASLPSRDQRGERLTNSPLALDLRYLLTAYGANDFEAEILLGYGMQLLHETPVLTREAIRRALAPASPVDGSILPPALKSLSAADLADQVEQIKICPHFLDSEEMSRLWSMFQVHYRSSTAYHVSVVLIESRRSTRAALPVREDGYNVYTVPFRQPVIERVRSQAGLEQPIVIGERLVIVGQRLRGRITRIQIGPFEEEPDPDDVSDTQISLPIPAGLRAGVQGAQVVHRMKMGTPPQEHRSVESNVVAFVLRPTLKKKTDGTYNIRVTDRTVTEGTVSAKVKVKVEPKVGKEQRVTLLLNEFGAPPERPARVYSFQAQPWPDPTKTELDTIGFEISGVDKGRYLVRLQVDGAESLLEVGADNKYVSPQVRIR